MEIRLIFPDKTPGYFENEVGEVNRHIGEENKESLPLRLFYGFLYVVSLVCSLLFCLRLWGAIINAVTARGYIAITLGIASCALMFWLTYQLISWFVLKLEDKALRAVGKEYKETYTTSPYAERKDKTKYAKSALDYYGLCSLLKSCRIYDVSVEMEGRNLAKVSLAYTDPERENHLAKLSLPCETGDTSCVIIDLRQALVILPAA